MMLFFPKLQALRIKIDFAVNLNDVDFEDGGLNKQSFIRPNKLFTADRSTFISSIGRISEIKMKEITTAIMTLIYSNET